MPTKFFDRIKISFIGAVLTLNDQLQLYYAYHTPGKFTKCGNPPLEPLHYYPFNGNGKDIISNNDLLLNSNTIFQNDIVCGKGVYGNHNPAKLKNDSSSFKGVAKTIAFWVKMDNVPLYTDGYPTFTIANNKIEIRTDSHTITAEESETLLNNVPNLLATDNITPDELTHFTFVYNDISPYNNDISACIYKNGILSDHIPYSACGIIRDQDFLPGSNVSITLKQAKIDELLIYDRALTSDEVKALACSYGVLPNCTSGTSAPASKVIAPTEIFTVSPNPTTGQITLDGNILLVGSDISIRNTSGMEVYHAAFKSKTFDLPATLPGGVYMLTLQTKDKKAYTRKIILTR